MRQCFGALLHQSVEMVFYTFSQLWQYGFRAPLYRQAFERRFCLRDLLGNIAREFSQSLCKQGIQEFSLGGRGCSFKIEMHIFNNTQEIGVPNHEHGGKIMKSFCEYGRRQQADHALYKFGFTGQG